MPEKQTFSQEEVGQLLAKDRRGGASARQLDAVKAERDGAPTTRVAAAEPLAQEHAQLQERSQTLAGDNERLLLEGELISEAVQRGAKRPQHVVRLLDRDGVVVGDGKVKGAGEALEAFQRANPDYFSAASSTPSDGGARERSGPRREPAFGDILRGGLMNRGG